MFKIEFNKKTMTAIIREKKLIATKYVFIVMFIIAFLWCISTPNSVHHSLATVHVFPTYTEVVEPATLSTREYIKNTRTIVEYLIKNYKELNNEEAYDIAIVILSCEQQFKINREIIIGLIDTESSFRGDIINKKSGASGFTQIMPATWFDILCDENIMDSRRDLIDTVSNITGGCFILREYLDSSDNNLRKALKKYGGFLSKRQDFDKYYSDVVKTANNYSTFENKKNT